MSSNEQTSKEKYESLLNEIRTKKTLPILEKIYEDLKNNKDNLFNNEIVPFQFSNDFIWLLKFNIINIQKQMDIFKLYIESFFNNKNKIENLNQIFFLFDIFNYDSNFFEKATTTDNFKVFLIRFFNQYYPKDTSIKHKVGDIMDVGVTEERNKLFLPGWIQLKLVKIDEEKKLYYFEDYKDKSKYITFPMDFVLVQERNTFVTEEEMNWRENLKPGDKLDFLNGYNNWVEATVKEMLSEKLINIETFGQNDNQKNIYNVYSPYIQPHLKYSFKYEPDEMNCLALLEINNNFQRYNYIAPSNEKNHLVPYYEIKFYSLEYYELINFFLDKVMETKILMNENSSLEQIYVVINVLAKTSYLINQKFIGEYFENCLENIKKILINFSLDKKVNKQKYIFDIIITYLQSFISFIHYPFQLMKIFPEFIIEFGINCFKNSENLEKRLIGLNNLFYILEAIQKYYSILPDDTSNKITKIINDKLLNTDTNYDLLDLIYNDINIHEQLLNRGIALIKKIGLLKLLKDKDIERLYNFTYTVPLDTDMYLSIFVILNDIAKEMDLSQQKVIFDKIIALSYDKIRDSDIILMSHILQSIKDDEDFKKMAEQYLDYYYNYIYNIINNKKEVEKDVSRFAKILTYAKTEDNIKYLYCHYFEKVLNDLNNQDNLEKYKYFFEFLRHIFGCIEEKNENMPICLPFIKNEFKKIFLEKYKKMEIIIDKVLELNNKDKTNEKNNENYILKIIDDIEKLIYFIEERNFIDLESFKKLCEFFIFSDVLRENSGSFLFKFSNLNKNVFDKNAFCEYFFNRFDKYLDSIDNDNPLKDEIIDSGIVISVFEIFNDINKPNKETLATDANINEYLYSMKKYTTKQNPLEMKYFDIIWKMLLKFKECHELKDFLELFSLKNFSPSERHEIWEQLIQKIFKDIDTNIPLSLKMLELIIKISEKWGSGGAKAHYIELKKKFPVKINIHNDISNLLPEFNFTEQDEKFYSTDTMNDIKKRIKNKYNIDPIFLDIDTRKSKIDYNLNDSTLTLSELYPELEKNKNEEINLFFRKGDITYKLPYYPLKSGNDVTPKFEQILREIFYKFAKDSKLNLENYKNYFRASVRVEALAEMEKTAEESFHKFDSNKKGFWTFENFSLFFIYSLDSKKSSIYKNLANLGYTQTLDYYLSQLNNSSPLYYEENNVKEFMPRYFIGNNKEYIEKLFSYAKSEDKKILEKAQYLLQQLCTSEEIKRNIFEKGDKIEEIISNNNLELRGYAFDILLSEFENEEKDESKQILENNFINNNLNKLIIELEKFTKGNDIDKKEEIEEENKIITYFNFYLSNLKIILSSFKNIVENKDIIDEIDKYESLRENNENNILKVTKVELNDNKKNIIQKLLLNNLVNIIGNGIIVLNDKIEDIYTKAVDISLKLLIYIVLFAQFLPEKEKIEIYKNCINYETTLSLTSCYKIKSQFNTANKLLLNFMNNEEDKKYILTKYEQLSKEIMNFNTLNIYDYKVSELFDIYILLFDISIKSSQNDKIFSLYEELLKLILDKNITLNEYVIKGYLRTIRTILQILKDEKYNKLYEYNFESLIQIIINEFLIAFDKDENNKINEIENLKYYSKYSDYEYIDKLFKILTIIISLNPEKYLKLFFLNENIKNLREMHLTKIDESLPEYNPYVISRGYNSYTGLKNLSSICYMNSVLQQFFKMPLFRNAILSLPLPDEYKEEKEDIDNLLYQLIRMFYYLNYSEQKDYNPKNFVFSFKDYEGNPTRIDIQCDAQEFLSRFIEKVEEGLKNNNQRYLCSNILGGSTLQQVKCTNPECGNISERRENINYLSLDIKNTTNVDKCLENFIKEETIEDYHCEKCDKKITNIKNVLIDKIPNFLIIHLQRITFSYETFNMEKINNYIKFDKTLNIKKFTVNKDNDEIPSEYFDYDLLGIIIHSGTAQYGHYYSCIKEEGENYSENWYKFNDSNVKYEDYEVITHDAFGSSGPYQYGSSAYMLVYEKRTKKPVIINSKELEEKYKKILEEKKDEKLDKIEFDNGTVYDIYENEKDAIEKNTNMKEVDKDENKIDNLENKVDKLDKNIILKNGFIEAKLVSYDEALDLLKKENKEEKEKKPFLKSILLENIKMCNDKKFYSDSFSVFIKEEIKLIKEEIINDKTGQKINQYIPLLKQISDYIIHILSFYNYLQEQDSDSILKNIIDILEYSIPKELLSYLIKDIIMNNLDNFYSNYICSKEMRKSKIICLYIGKIISVCYNNDIENDSVIKIIQFYLNKIPVEITKEWLCMEGFNYFVLTLVQNSDKIKKYFIQNEVISKLIDLIMGKDSPLYQGDERTENKNNKPKYGNIVKSIALLYQYYLENYQKEELNLSKNDIIMINTNKFYEKVIMEDYDSDASNMLIDYKMDLDVILNKEENKEEEFKNDIIDIIIKLKIPSIKTKDDIISTINLISLLIKKLSDIYNIDNEEEKNKEKFLEKLNILLGIAIPNVTEGNAEIKYISGKYQNKFTILNNIFSPKEEKKEVLNLLKPLFNLFYINKTVFDYLDNLPAPNSFKYSFVDYYIKLFLSIEKDIAENNNRDELNSLLIEICSKYKKDLESIKNNFKIDLDNSLHFHEFFFNTINKIELPEKMRLIKGKLLYISGRKVQKTNLPCFTQQGYFTNTISRNTDEKFEYKDGYEMHCVLCIVIYSEKIQNIIIDFKPYLYSNIEIEAKKDNHYFFFCIDIDDNIKNNDDEIDKIIDFNNIKIKTEEKKIEVLPIENNTNQIVDDSCTINCPTCGTVNVLNDENPEFKCSFCEAPLF